MSLKNIEENLYLPNEQKMFHIDVEVHSSNQVKTTLKLTQIVEYRIVIIGLGIFLPAAVHVSSDDVGSPNNTAFLAISSLMDELSKILPPKTSVIIVKKGG